MENDCFKHVQKFHLCQIYADKINQSPSLLHTMTRLWPFLIWSIYANCMINSKTLPGIGSFLWPFIVMGRGYVFHRRDKDGIDQLHLKQHHVLIRVTKSIITNNANNLNKIYHQNELPTDLKDPIKHQKDPRKDDRHITRLA